MKKTNILFLVGLCATGTLAGYGLHRVFPGQAASARISSHATTMAAENPGDTASWVDSLPAGEARTWAQGNVLKNWTQYDPDAAKAWEKSLSASDREALGKIRR